MPRKGKRQTIAKGIYKDGEKGGYEVRVTVGGTPYSEHAPKDSTLEELKKLRAKLEHAGRTATPKAERHSLRYDAARFLKLITHLVKPQDYRRDLDAWCERLGDTMRHRITPNDVMTARTVWRKTIEPKSVQHRIDTLRNLYHRLDGAKAPTPCDGIPKLKSPKTIIERVTNEMILAVDAKLQERERDRELQFDGAKTRARFRVFVATGKRPCEIMRAKPSDVNLKARVWVPRDAKGGFCPGVYLNDDQIEAWKLFIAADAWGTYNHGNFGRVIRKAGWPADVRPYQARHTMWITASEMGIDLADISIGAGHKDQRTTRAMYVPVLNSRLQRLSEAVAGRFQGWPVVPISGTSKRARKQATKIRP